jgi:O-methyltransferase involved in polyketide biosynthesis
MIKCILLLIAIVAYDVIFVTGAVKDEIFLRGTNDHTSTPTAKIEGTNEATLFIRALYQDCDDSNDDYLAASFLQEPKKTIVSNKFTRDATRNGLATVSLNNAVYFSARTVYLDKILQDAIENGIKQVVVIAAGYDSRAYRFGKQG